MTRLFHLTKNLTGTLALVLLFFSKTQAAKVDTAAVYSSAMHRAVNTVFITPDGYDKAQQYPVMYLLHGFSGKYSDWILKVPAIQQLADKYHMIIVCPDGGFAGWYFDSPMIKDSQYETYVAKDAVNYTDTHYSTIRSREGRAITGLSMGGHGALYIAFRHLDVFGAAGSMSGAVDLRPFADAFGIEQVLGKYSQYPERWEAGSVVNMLHLLKPNSLQITFECGYDDFLYQANLELHDKMLLMKIPHDFTVRPGGHSWDYWANAITYQALFFSRYFEKEGKK